jgi:hypothetical protein
METVDLERPMKKYLFLILISCVLILTAILAGLSLEPASYYLENKAGFFQQEVEAPAAVQTQKATDQEDGLNVEYVSDQAIRVQLPEARLQEQLELALGAFSFSLEGKQYEDVAEQACLGTSIAPELGSPGQEATQGGEDKLQSQPQDPYAIYLWHPSTTTEEYKLMVAQEELQADLSLACATHAEDSEMEW